MIDLIRARICCALSSDPRGNRIMAFNSKKTLLIFLLPVVFYALVQTQSITFDVKNQAKIIIDDERLSATGSYNLPIKYVELAKQTGIHEEDIEHAILLPISPPPTSNWTDSCTLLPEEKAPTPIILMALGRSGSSVTWDTMSALTGERNVAHEVTGGNLNSSLAFFEHELQDNPLAYGNWTLQRLCHVQQHRPDISNKAGIAGFQWKPYMTTFHHAYAISGLKAITEHNRSGKKPLVKVVYLHRNALDRQISNIRHRNSKMHESVRHDNNTVGSRTITKLSAHCAVGDDECVRKHSKIDPNIILPTGEELLKKLRNEQRHEYAVLSQLKNYDVPFHAAAYKGLYNTDISDDASAEEWMRIFRFIGKGPTDLLKMKHIRDTFSMASTHSKSRNETISNFDDVRDTLVGTEFEHLLSN